MNEPLKSLDPRYMAFIEIFNRGEFFEAHEILEPLWLSLRKTPEALFYKGLIQLAGAFVHLQKKRPLPAAALLNLAKNNLGKFEPGHKNLDSKAILDFIDTWLSQIPQSEKPTPQIRLIFQ